MAEAPWRVTPDGEKQWQGADGNWYPNEVRATLAGTPVDPSAPRIYRRPKPKYSDRSARTAVLVFLIAAGLIAIGIVVANAVHNSSGTTADAAYIAGHRQDFRMVTAGVADIETEIGLLDSSGPVSTDIDQVALTALHLHDVFDGVHSDLLSTDSSNGVVEVWTASGELRDSMADLGTYTGNPNPESLAKFTSLFQQAISDWNQGVGDLWNSAHESNPPIIKGPNGNTGTTGGSGNTGNT